VPETAPNVEVLRARPEAHSGRGFTTADLARRFRVSEERVRGWITRGELVGINTSDARCKRPRYVVTPEALAAFEKTRAAADPPRPRRRRPPKKTNYVDYFPGA
jgi:transposase